MHGLNHFDPVRGDVNYQVLEAKRVPRSRRPVNGVVETVCTDVLFTWPFLMCRAAKLLAILQKGLPVF